ncbi:hypothetical protein MFLAVUS_007080 [Mucor flavus]|uniref:Uncharacterized protein n=1 Tax=Mucor flavus TaxID=439312 RepID=A0ABP9Z3E3_9FUNG
MFWNGANFARIFKRKFVPSTDQSPVTPIESIGEERQESVNLAFVMNKRADVSRRFK